MALEEETITLTVKEYRALTANSKLAECLRDAGVDNWDGYEYALELLEEQA